MTRVTRVARGAAHRSRWNWNDLKASHIRRLKQADDRGMTLIELIVTVALTSLVITMTTVIIVNVLNATAGENATISGVQQATLAERTFTQYMRSTVQLLSVDPNDLTFKTYAGMGSGPSPATACTVPVVQANCDVPQLETLEIQLCATKSANVDSLEVLYGLPQSPTTGWSGLHECISPNSPTPDPNPIPAGVRLVEAFDISPPGTAVPDIFSYFSFQATKFTQVSTSSLTTPCTPSVTAPACVTALATIASVGINITFLPPPGGISKGYHDELGTTVQAQVFIRNASEG